MSADTIGMCAVGLYIFLMPHVSFYIEYQLIRGETEEKRRKGFKALKIHCAIVSLLSFFFLIMFLLDKSADAEYILIFIFPLLIGYLYHAYPTLVRRSNPLIPFKDVAVPGVRSFSKKVCLVWVILVFVAWIIRSVIYK